MVAKRQYGVYIVLVLIVLFECSTLFSSSRHGPLSAIQRQCLTLPDFQVDVLKAYPQNVTRPSVCGMMTGLCAGKDSIDLHIVLLTMVITAPGNKDRRDAIRETWKNSYVEQGKQFDVRFIMGTLDVSDDLKESLLAENEKYNDLVLLTDHLDSYQNLTRKVLHMFMWADQNVNYSYMLKTDDDTFVRLDRIEFELKARNNEKLLYWGRIGKNIQPRTAGKWKEKKWDISDKYLPYAFGGGYVLSSGLVHRISINADVLILYNSEDVSVGAWVSPFELERKHDLRFAVTPRSSKECNEQQLVLHNQFHCVDKINTMHKRLTSNRTMCE